ncbi:MAG: energy transducer TonB [Nitrospirales bacterium]|nr:energy transducer TonB [Nitrospirales bacterium]
MKAGTMSCGAEGHFKKSDRKDQTRGITVSLIVHGFIIALLVLFGNLALPEKPPLVIDFTMKEPEMPAQKDSVPKAAAWQERPRPQRQTHEAPQQIRKPEAPLRSSKPVSHVEPQPLPALAQTAPSPQALPAAVASGRAEQPGGSGTGNSAGPGVGAGASRAGSGDSPSGNGGEGIETLKKKYHREHFTYIRDLVMKNLSYPLMARRMGWEGKVIISFVVSEDGSVKNITIQESSGHGILDKNAVETVKRACPLPKPPVKAELVIPIVYSLK